MAVYSVDIKKTIISVILDLQKNLNTYRSEYDLTERQILELVNVSAEINKIIDALEFGAELSKLKIKSPKVRVIDLPKLKRVLDLTFRYKSDLNTVAMDIGEKLPFTNQLLQSGVDYICENLKGKKFTNIDSLKDTVFGAKPIESGKKARTKVKSKPVAKGVSFIAQLLFFVVLIGGGYFIYSSIFDKPATRVSSLVKEYRSDRELSASSRPDLLKTIKVAGSSSVLNPVRSWKDGFLAANKGLSLEIESSDSGPAIAKLIDGEITIAAASRIPNITERKKSQKANRLLADHKIALDAVAVIVHPSNPIESLSIEDLKEIFTDEFDKKYSKFSPSPESGTYEFFHERVLFMEPFAKNVVKMYDINQVIEMVETNESAIAFSSVANVLGRKVKVVPVSTVLRGEIPVSPIDGDKLNITAVKRGEYPLTRYLYLITAGELDLASAKFIDYYRSSEGQSELAKNGLVSIY